MYCTICGQAIRDGLAFCPSCGTPVEPSEIRDFSPTNAFVPATSFFPAGNLSDEEDQLPREGSFNGVVDPNGVPVSIPAFRFATDLVEDVQEERPLRTHPSTSNATNERNTEPAIAQNFFFPAGNFLDGSWGRNMEGRTTTPVVLSANIQSKKVKVGSKLSFSKHEKELLRDIRIDIREGTLVAVLGTAGAGKSTLMGCLSGLDQDGVTGTVVYRGVDLIQNLDEIKYLIGNVPQEKVIRPELTPEQAFRESAELRLSADTTKEQIRDRVEKTLELLSMTRVRDTLNSRLSGGEQTRVNVGIDLVADRDIYFLDEPEQGLSPNLRTELYVFLRTLAHTHGKTIVAIIHDVSCIDMFDQVIFLVKANGVGRLAFSGSPEEGGVHFGVPIAEAYALLEANPEKYVR